MKAIAVGLLVAVGMVLIAIFFFSTPSPREGDEEE